MADRYAPADQAKILAVLAAPKAPPPYPTAALGQPPSGMTGMAASAWHNGGWIDHAYQNPAIYAALPQDAKDGMARVYVSGKLPAGADPSVVQAVGGRVHDAYQKATGAIPYPYGYDMAGVKGP